MIARVGTWFEDGDPGEIRRWAIAGAIVVALHVLVLCPYTYFYHPDQLIGDNTSPISLDLSPSNDTVDRTEILPTPDPPPQVEEPPPEPQPPPPPPQPQAIIETPPPPPPKVEEQPQEQSQPARVKGGAPHVPPSWITAFRRHILQFKRYPSTASKHSQQGIVEVSFTVDRTGHVLSREVAHSSGFSALDNEALALFDRAQPLPPFTPSMKEDQLTLTVPILFDLSED